MENQTLTTKTGIDEKKSVRVISSLEALSDENNELLAHIESLRKSNSAIKTGCSEILSSTNKLIESIRELALLLN